MTNAHNAITRQSVLCPSCEKRGKPVKPITLRALLKVDYQADITDGPYRFCDSTGCETVYYAADGSHRFAKSDLTVRVGLKETDPPRHVCYCFDHTVEEIEDQVKRTGSSTVLDEIKTRMKVACWCETKSPQGVCCLGAVSRTIKEAQARFGAGGAGARAEKEQPSEDCCAPGAQAAPRFATETSAPGKRSRWNVGAIAQMGAILSAVVASACCWLPLLLIAFGVSGGALAATFEQYRPVFLPMTFALLAAAFYFAYRKPRVAAAGANAEACCTVPAGGDDGASCCPPEQKGLTLKKFNKVMLWAVTAWVLAFAFFPNYVGILMGGRTSLADHADLERWVSQGEAAEWSLRIEGMTCPGCEAGLQGRLAKVPGVVGARVSYEQGRAIVTAEHGVPEEKLRRAVQEAGYEVVSAVRK